MKAYLFSVGESTTDVARWSLERHGLEVVTLYDPKTSFHDKYMQFLDMARDDDMVLRWDADVIATRGLTDLIATAISLSEVWWITGSGYCHLKHEIVTLSGNVMKREALGVGRKRMAEFSELSRPETALSRVDEFYNPRRFQASDMFIGLHGYRQKQSDINRVMAQKEERGQLGAWDLELINKLSTIQ